MYSFEEVIENKLQEMFFGDTQGVFDTDNPNVIQDLLSYYNGYNFFRTFRVGERTYTATLTIKEND